jgi:TetR/AcrR family transcriptional repressor of nem operon
MTDKRAEIEAAATRAIRQGGYNSLSFRTLAAEVGVKSSSVHYHFPNKAALAQALVEGYTATLAARLSTIRSTHDSAGKRLNAFVDIFADGLKEEGFCLCGMLSAEVNAMDDATRQTLGSFFDVCEQWLERELREQPQALPVAPRALARLIMSGLEGANLIDRVDGRRERTEAWRRYLDALLG